MILIAIRIIRVVILLLEWAEDRIADMVRSIDVMKK